MNIKIFPTPPDLFTAAAKDFAQRAKMAITEKNQFTVSLAGASTAKLFFDTLTANPIYKQIPWQKIKFFFGDERYVPADDPESNYRLAQQHLFTKMAVPTENVYRIPTEFSDPKMAAKNYEMTLRNAFKLTDNQFPQFDLVYLGFGEDAHTASLMPFSDVVTACIRGENSHQLVASLWVPALKMYRITLTPAAINHSTQICFLVTGEKKALALSQTLQGPFEPERYPAQLIQNGNNNIIWYLDKKAAEKLTNNHSA